MKPKNLLITGHTRSGGHFLMNSIAANFKYYDYHRRGQDFFKRSKMEKNIVPKLQEQTNVIQISRQQYWSFKPYKKELDKNWIVFYILRDGRDVISSLWDMHRKEYKWTDANNLYDFLISPMSHRSYETRVNIMPTKNPIESWLIHWQSWLNYFGAEYPTLPTNFIRYNALYYNFEQSIQRIGKIIQMRPEKIIKRPDKQFNSIRPRKGVPDQWREAFTKAALCHWNNYLWDKDVHPAFPNISNT